MARAVTGLLGRSAGWLLAVAGVVLFPLPGPGLLLLAAGLALLARYHDWAARRVERVRLRAIRGAAAGVQTRARTWWSVLATLAVTASGAVWLVVPPPPEWWVLPDWLWFPGGAWAAVGQAVSGLVMLALVWHSYHRFHGRPEELAALDAALSGNAHGLGRSGMLGS